jgi:hypothetical protein
MNFNEEQEEIIRIIETILDNEHIGYSWEHFQGDVVPGILAYYSNTHNIIPPR